MRRTRRGAKGEKLAKKRLRETELNKKNTGYMNIKNLEDEERMCRFVE